MHNKASVTPELTETLQKMHEVPFPKPEQHEFTWEEYDLNDFSPITPKPNQFIPEPEPQPEPNLEHEPPPEPLSHPYSNSIYICIHITFYFYIY